MGLKVHAVIINMRQALFAVSHIVVTNRAPVGTFRIGNGSHVNHLFEPRTQAHHLEPAGVGEGWPVPVHKPPQPAGGIQNLGAGLQIQVVGVRQKRLRPKLLHRFGKHRLDGRLRTHGRKGGSLNIAVRGANHTRAPQKLPAVSLHTLSRRGCGLGQAAGDGEPETGVGKLAIAAAHVCLSTVGGVLAAGHWRAEIPREEPAQRIKTVILVTLARPPWGRTV